MRVVFVHGLQGHPHKTWTSDPKRDKTRGLIRKLMGTKSRSIKEEGNQGAEAKNVFWPRDLLSKDFPTARIMTFGYDNSARNHGTFFSHARDLLYGLVAVRNQSPNRDLVFIAHSYGGLLVKEVLRRSSVDSDQKITKISGSTTGVFFFSTPHRGVDVNTRVNNALFPSPELISICQESFTVQQVKRGDNLTVRTFQESKGITGTRRGGFNQPIVPPDSFTLDPSQCARTIDADHIGMVKFSGENDKAYEMVKEDIEKLVIRAGEAVYNVVSGM
ncbi:MAG: hypothetical protein M1840_002255 [Geoglossum simile]|nr:MAG: hypothetical protein M1840_002255 [Geoglossum simile]